MSIQKKRAYDSTSRKAAAELTKGRIIDAAKSLFGKKGFEKVTIEEIAEVAGVSAPTVYSVYLSKKGVLLAVLDDALAAERYDELYWKSIHGDSPEKRLMTNTRLARVLYDAEKERLSLLHGSSAIDPVFKDLEKEMEERRYRRQEEVVKALFEGGYLKDRLTLADARDILWVFTGRDIYRMLVVERGWTSDQYEKWIGESLIRELLK
ncbi:TetR/AcrR family transcriptional regulator [Estrella lausannensis]|uniref:Transcriptional regulator, TetR family n=1 Tax=Estrella lausannensis TaxID=483423 RepID=A0A0H5DPW9_9BACT|nr:TetR/AcrR family transcriptional regulator [Estrella lausannensis]CRX37559.1 transcriptional regulator, TetR family [Estrella lausannensis]